VQGEPKAITIDDVHEDDTLVRGTAEKGYAVTLLVPQVPWLERTVTVQDDATYEFAGLDELVGGHTIVVSGYGQQASTTVIAQEPPGPYMEVQMSGTCLEWGSNSVTVTTWLDGSVANYYKIYVDAVLQHENIGIDDPTGFSHQLVITVSEATAELVSVTVELLDSSGSNVLHTLNQEVPVCQDDAMPDLTISDLTVLNAEGLETYQPIHASVTIENTGSGRATSLFWVALYLNHDTESEVVLERAAFTALDIGAPISFTMVIDDGFTALGSYTLTAEVDPWEQIVELEEANNKLSNLLVLEVEGTPPDPGPIVPPEAVGGVAGFVDIGGARQALAEVTVHAYPPVDSVTSASSLEGGTATGHYSLDDVPVGTWLISASVMLDTDYYYGSRPVVVTEGQTTDLMISMDKLAVFSSTSMGQPE